MTDTLISFETAKLAKEKGFDETTFEYYVMKENLIKHRGLSSNSTQPFN